MMTVTHDDLLALVQKRPSDYEPWGLVSNNERGNDCSWGCVFALWLRGSLGADWCVCANPDSERAGLLTFEHQAGAKCFVGKSRKAKKIS